MDDWISTSDAAKMLGYTRGYFLEIFCNAEKPLVTIRQRGLANQSASGKIRRRILVSRASILALMASETKHPERS
jgi:hypothetical protein